MILTNVYDDFELILRKKDHVIDFVFTGANTKGRYVVFFLIFHENYLKKKVMYIIMRLIYDIKQL